MAASSKTSTNEEEIRKYDAFVEKFTTNKAILCGYDEFTPGFEDVICLTKQFLALNHSVIPNCDFNIRTRYGLSLLMIVASNTRKHFTEKDVMMLIENGTGVNLQDDWSNGELDWFDEDYDPGWTALMISACQSNTASTENTVKLLIEAGADVNIRSVNGWTALHTAASGSNMNSSNETVRILIDAGADINARCVRGSTPLTWAANYSNVNSSEETVRLLIEAGADVNRSGLYGMTPLMLATQSRNLHSTKNTVKMLLEAGADVNLQDDDGWTALMLAIQHSYDTKTTTKETVNMLLDAGSDVNLQNRHGYTALMLTANYSYESVVNRILKAGADVNLKDKDEWTVHTYAKDNINITQMLKNAST